MKGFKKWIKDNLLFIIVMILLIASLVNRNYEKGIFEAENEILQEQRDDNKRLSDELERDKNESIRNVTYYRNLSESLLDSLTINHANRIQLKEHYEERRNFIAGADDSTYLVYLRARLSHHNRD